MKEIKCAIIGLGFFGEKHAEVLSDMGGVELSAVCDARGDRLKEVADKFKVPQSYTDYKELLADEQIDMVSIVTHYTDHHQVTVDALKAGKNVFLEKPMAATVDQCRDIVNAARKAKGIFAVGHICRFDPRVVAARKAIEDGKVGKILYMHAKRNLPTTVGQQVLDKISALFGDGIHDTDLMLWFTKSKVQTVYACQLNVTGHKNADIGTAVYRFESGAIGVIETVWALPANTEYTIDARFEIIGTKGAIYIDCGNAGVTINSPDRIHKPDTVYWPDLYNSSTGALRNELQYFINCITKDTMPEVITPEESMYAVEVVCAAEKSASIQQIVNLE